MTIADGPLIVAVDKARQMLADCYYWRRIKTPDSAWDDATALGHIYIDDINPETQNGPFTRIELERKRPFARVWLANDDGFIAQTVTTAHDTFATQYKIHYQLELAVPGLYANDDDALGRYFSTLLGQIIWTSDATKPGLLDLSGDTGGLYPTVTLLKSDSYERIEKEYRANLGDFAFCNIEIATGVRSA